MDTRNFTLWRREARLWPLFHPRMNEGGHFLSFRHLKQSTWRTSAVAHINSRSIRAGFYNEAIKRAPPRSVLLSWPRYIDGMREFRDVTYPLAKQAGLRNPA